MMRFVHLTDTHIGSTPEFGNYGHSTLHNLEYLIDQINALPFAIDFVLHTGDVIEDRSEAAYQLARTAFSRLTRPVYYVAGNHDHSERLQRVLLGQSTPYPRLDYSITCASHRILVLDSTGPKDPGGRLLPEQIDALREVCTYDAMPLVIALHHPPFPVDAPWIDQGTPWMPGMLLENGADFLDAIQPASNRIRAVLFGHLHRSFQIMRQGILFCSAPSAFAQLQSWPHQAEPLPAPYEPAGINLVTVQNHQTIVRQHYFERPLKP